MKDVIGALLLGGAGTFFLVEGISIRQGSAARMGPGYLPTVLSAVLILLSLPILVRGLRSIDGLRIDWRPMLAAWRQVLAVSASVIAFGLTLERLGLVPAVMLATFLAALGDPESRPVSTILLALLLALASWGVFKVGLGLPLQAFAGLF